MQNKKVTVYVDGIDWMYEVGHAADGNKVYPDINCLKKYNRCWEGCGIVKCELIFKEWTLEHNWKKMAENSKTYTAKQLKEDSDILRLEAAEKRLEWLEELLCEQKHRVIDLKATVKNKKRKKK